MCSDFTAYPRTSYQKVSFRLDLSANYSIAPTFHVSLLKPAGGPREEEVNEEAETQRPPPILVEGEEAYQCCGNFFHTNIITE